MALRLLRTAPRASRPCTAFVLSGGGSLGALQAGMLRALYEREICPDLLVGTSVGSVNAGFIASRPPTVATADELASVWLSLQRDDVFPVSVRALIGGLRSKRDHLVPDHALRHLVRSHVELTQLEDATIPLHIVCYDLTGGREVRLSTGPAREAIVASCSIPGILPPVRIADRYLVDGGVANGTPISHAIALGAQRVYVLSTSDRSRIQHRPDGSALDAAANALRVLLSTRLEIDLERYSNQVELTVLPAANESHVQPSDFDHASELIAEALASARQLLDDAERPLTGRARATAS